MDLFAYRDGRLFAEDVAVEDIARAVGTPFYAYSATMMRTQYRAFADAFGGVDATVCYAMKANANRAVIALFEPFDYVVAPSGSCWPLKRSMLMK